MAFFCFIFSLFKLLNFPSLLVYYMMQKIFTWVRYYFGILYQSCVLVLRMILLWYPWLDYSCHYLHCGILPRCPAGIRARFTGGESRYVRIKTDVVVVDTAGRVHVFTLDTPRSQRPIDDERSGRGTPLRKQVGPYPPKRKRRLLRVLSSDAGENDNEKIAQGFRSIS